jgi:hypothetical protein
MMKQAKICMHPMRNALLASVTQGLLLATLGCSSAPGSETGSNEEAAAEVNQNLSGSAVFIYFSDGRTASNVITTVAGTDQATGSYYSDWEAVGGSLPPPSTRPRKLSQMIWTNGPSNRLDESYFINNPLSDPYSMITIDDWSTGQFTNMRVTVRATINGYCHEDWEDINWTTRPTLYFNGNGATWNGSCYTGNLLRTSP